MHTEHTNELDTIDTSDLKEKMAVLALEISRREKDEKIRKARLVESLAIESGFSTLAEVTRLLAGEVGAGRSAVIYRNPDDPTQTWASRGRKPRWLHDYLRSGGSLSMLPRTEKCEA